MPSNESPTVSVCRSGDRRIGSDPLRTVVWVGGEHDAATRALLSTGLADASALDHADLVVDLSGVTFMDASTIHSLIGARDHLRDLSRSLCVRDPSRRARRLLHMCGLTQMIDEHPTPTRPPVASALCSWVDVPAQAREPRAATAPIVPPVPEPARVTVRRRTEPVGSIQQPCPPS